MPTHLLYFLDDRFHGITIRGQHVLFAIPGDLNLGLAFLDPALAWLREA
jgi:hypothetical protein